MAKFTHLLSEAGSLLSRMRFLGATFEEIRRASSLLETANNSTIGPIIHDLQLQIQDLEQENIEWGINPECFVDFKDD